MRSKAWIILGVSGAVPGTIMREILRNIGAPYTAWATVKANLQKYSRLRTTKFSCCRKHMLLRSILQQSQDSESNLEPCEECIRRRETPELDSFEYISLKTRLKQWLKSEHTCKMLYQNMHANAFHARRGGDVFEDFYDGALFKDIVEKRGGVEAAKWDIFLSVSCDGFQTFHNNSYDCWPVVAMVENLPPDVRFLLKNSVPLGIIKGPSEVIRLDTFFIPLVREVVEMNEEGGTSFEFWDGRVRNIQVHIVFMKGDAPAVAKMSGTTGLNGLCPCRFCKISGTRDNHANHYYYPSMEKVRDSGSGLRRILRHLHPGALPMRRAQGVKEVWAKHEMAQSRKARASIATATGVKARTHVYDIPSIVPLASFPIDLMHMVMKIVKDFMNLWKGVHECSKQTERGEVVYEDFVLGDDGWNMIDEEISSIGLGSSQDVFGPRPRGTCDYRKWKASECKAFILWCAPVLLSGHLPARYLKGVCMLSKLMGLCHHTILTEDDVQQIESLSLSFYNHVENEYYRFEPSRIRLCKRQLHYILHLGDNIRMCGPLVNPSQFWMEHYVGFIKHGLHATTKAAEALTENMKLVESAKLMFNEHVFVQEPEFHSDNEDNEDNSPEGNEVTSQGLFPGFMIRSPTREYKLSSPQFRRMQLRELLEEYILRVRQSMSQEEAEACVQS